VSSQRRLAIGVLAGIAVIAGYWILLLSPKRADSAHVTDQIVQAQSRRDAAITAAAQAEKAKAGYQRDYATLARLGKAVPADDDVASLVYQIESIARANKVDFRSLKLTGAASAPPAAAKAPAKTDGDSTDKKTDPTSATTPVAPVVAQQPPGSVVGEAGLLTVPFTFTFDGDYLKLQRFLKAVNGLANDKGEQITVRGRLLTVDGFALVAGHEGLPQLKAIESATAYLAPDGDSAASTAPQTPAGAATGAPTTTAMVTPNAQGAGR
jgi:hypothetical protein